jgi:hypothetical protein
MAANDYYNTSYAGAQGPKPPLPLPGSQPQHQGSPISPFEDHTYPPYPSSTHSSGAAGGYGDTSYHSAPPAKTPYSSSNHYDPHNDPFTDHNAIPLRHQPKMDGHKLDDGSPSRYNADPEQFPLPGREKKKKKKKKKGWFSGRVTWVVYILTTVQIGVFIGELIKNGTLPYTPSLSVLCAR